MDRLVDQAEHTRRVRRPATRPRTERPRTRASLADIESELYCSNRETGISAVGFGPVADS